MTVKELLKELERLPKSYEIIVALEPFPAHPDMPPVVFSKIKGSHSQHVGHPECISAFMLGAAANKEMKCVYLFGCAVPKDSAACVHGDN